MSQTEKQSLINSLTLLFAEDYQLPIKEIKAKLTEALQQYHISINDEAFAGSDQSTEYLMKKFSDGKLAVGMSEKTINQYQIAVAKLEEYTDKQLADCEPEDIQQFLRAYSKKVSSVTVRAKYQLISSVYNFLFQHRYIAYNPILYVEPPKQTVIYKEPLTDLGLEKIKTVCEKLPEKEAVRDMALIYTFVATGCRVSELSRIKIKDIDFKNQTIKVLGKGKKERPVVINDKTIYRIKLYLDTREDTSLDAPLFAHLRGDEKGMTKDGIGLIIRELGKEAGLNKLTCHCFRRYYATELRKRNVNIQMIASSLGHANLNQINRYSLYNPSEMLNTIRNSI